MDLENNAKEEKHHQQLSVCTTRPPYRQGRKLTAIKTYTVASESQHLFIYGVPSINLRSELKTLCTKYGQIHAIHIAPDYKSEQFTECYHVQFVRIQSARIAKRLLDNKSFYGGVLHVCYAPEYETIAETRAKLIQRRKEVQERLQENLTVAESAPVKIDDFIAISKTQLKKKRRRTEEVTKRAWINEDDPLEPTNKRFKNDVEYGPTVNQQASVIQAVETVDERTQIHGGDPLKLVPQQVRTANQPINNTVKRIVFHRK